MPGYPCPHPLPHQFPCEDIDLSRPGYLGRAKGSDPMPVPSLLASIDGPLVLHSVFTQVGATVGVLRFVLGGGILER